MKKNIFEEMREAKGDPEFFREFLEFLSEHEIRFYGIRISPRNMAEVRERLLEHNTPVHDL